MNPEITNEDVAADTAALLRSLIELLVDRPADLTVDYRMMHGRVDFIVMPNINDQGKVVGKQGAHVKALKFLLARIGESAGQQYVLRLDEDPWGKREPEKPKPEAPPTYSYAKHLMVLGDILKAFHPEWTDVSVTAVPGQRYVFRISTASGLDYGLLVSQRQGGEFEGQSLVTALGTLYRAAGLRDGVEMRIEVPSR